jgi:hypothetical protein
MNSREYSITYADVQGVMVSGKRYWAKLRGKEESLLKLSYDEQFIKIAKEKGLGEQAEAVAKSVRGRGSEFVGGTNDRRTDGKIPSNIDEIADLDTNVPANTESVSGFLDVVSNILFENFGDVEVVKQKPKSTLTENKGY